MAVRNAMLLIPAHMWRPSEAADGSILNFVAQTVAEKITIFTALLFCAVRKSFSWLLKCAQFLLDKVTGYSSSQKCQQTTLSELTERSA